jgi:hypothetical protein
MRTFETGATRDTDKSKPDYDGFLSELVIPRFAEYMTKHRYQADGNIRSSDNWKKGVPKECYIKSLFRHFIDLWRSYKGITIYNNGDIVSTEDLACACLFNIQGFLHEYLKQKQEHNSLNLIIK